MLGRLSGVGVSLSVDRAGARAGIALRRRLVERRERRKRVSVDNVLYLHGFNSHPDSPKARQTCDACARLASRPRFVAPVLPNRPADAFAVVLEAFDSLEGPTLVIGSSMGGFLATCLAERRQVAVLGLINPAVHPVRLARGMVDVEQVNPVTGARSRVEPCYVDQLLELQPGRPREPSRFTVLLGGCDEVLDHREALRFYRGARVLVVPGDNHALGAYPRLLPGLLARAGLIG